jgi:uncharacterized membrane protein
MEAVIPLLMTILLILALGAVISSALALWAIKRVLQEGIYEILRTLKSINHKLAPQESESTQ